MMSIMLSERMNWQRVAVNAFAADVGISDLILSQHV